MCNWSNWSFLCDGRYDIALAILIGAAFLVALFFMFMSYRKKRSEIALSDDLAIVNLRELYEQGDLDADQFLNRCEGLAQRHATPGPKDLGKASQ
ncbi:MAG TPA: hypothetical protein VIF60_14420 [Burkholderiaceae bacterium]|jgi:uncharacterized membrane protein